jgi:hypothetical protein
MIGTPWRCATEAQSKMAVIWGTPIPATTRVVQIELCTTTLSAMKLCVGQSTSMS